MRIIMILGWLCLWFAIPASHAEDSFSDAIKNGQFLINFRYRFEHVNQEGLDNVANASTIRSRYGYKTGTFKNMSLLVEGENVTEAGKDSYNNTINGKTTYPVVADVRGAELNQGFLNFTGIEKTKIKAGRQIITVDNHRFIGDVGWRQNNQTFDSFTIVNKTLENTIAKYGYIFNVNRIFGNESSAGDWASNSHYFNISNDHFQIVKITAYGYLLDFIKDSPANSSQTFGVSVDGGMPLNENIMLNYHGEFAHQEDYERNQTNYQANYFHVTSAIKVNSFTGTIGFEALGSDDGIFGFRTPLATLHKFNGWADLFLTTPATGLEDFYVDLTYKISKIDGYFGFLNGLLIKTQYHDFSPEVGGGEYGSEWGIFFKKAIGKYLSAEAKYTDFESDGFATDRQKVTFGLAFNY